MKRKSILHKIINIAIQRSTVNVIALFPQLEQIRAVSLDAILKHIVPLTMKHFEYIILKTLAKADDEKALLHPNFIKKLAECRDQKDFDTLANEVQQKVQQPEPLKVLTNMMKFVKVMEDMAEFYTKRFRSELTARRIIQTSIFAKHLALNSQFRDQLYDHAASIFAMLEQQSPTTLIHFESLISLGSLTRSLAKQQKWDEEYIQRVQALYKMDQYEAQQWVEPFNRYLEARGDYRGAACYFKALLNHVVKPDQYFNLVKVKVATLTDNMLISQDDFKMITISTDILSIPGTIFQLEKTFSTSTQIIDDERVSTVEEILSQISSETNNTSRAISIINDEEQRGWNLSSTDLTQVDTDDESIILEVCDYFDGQAERICGAPLEPGQTRCPQHSKPEFNQPMEIVKQIRDIDPGRAFSLLKDLKVEIPKPKMNQNIKYANSMNGDTKDSAFYIITN